MSTHQTHANPAAHPSAAHDPENKLGQGADAAADTARAAEAAASIAAAQEGALRTPGKGDAPAEQADGVYAAGRVIIFTNRRDSVQSIVDMLRSQEPLITARSSADHAS